ncbi:hypothetical protein K7432_006131 [Basidiobolus ranarum]|uniref:Uncharacterized protein n=1 Tax=Basidiobolus ranarum TaxID=34480 RepID=A0ABR2W297_9FUNG
MPYLQRLEYCRLHKDQTTATYNQNILAIQDATEFVKIHVETFGDTLTEIKIPELSDLKCDGNQLGKQIWDIIKLLKRPSVIEVDDSYDFCQYIQGPIADHLRVFRGPLMRDKGGIPNWDSASLFQRSPKLEKVSFCPSGPDSFKWAVKKRALLLDSDCSSSSTSEIKLPPLQEVYVVCKNFAALRIVEDIIYAFQNTIRKIIVVDTHYIEFSPTPLSWDWLLPNLVKIHMIFVDLTMFDLESLNLCPSLEELSLIDVYEEGSSDPNISQIQSWLSQILTTIRKYPASRNRLVSSDTTIRLTLLDMDLGLEIATFKEVDTEWRISCPLSILLIGFMSTTGKALPQH